MTIVTVIGIYLLVTNLLVVIPLLLYSLYRFHKIRNDAIMKERKHKLVYYMNIISIISICIFQPFNVFSNMSKITILKSQTASWIKHILQTLFVCSIYALFLCKIWLLYFKQQYHTRLASQTWEKVINSRFDSWFVINKNTYGNDRYILKLILIPLFMSIVFELIAWYLHFRIDSVLIVSIILTIPACIFYLKLEDFQNVHKIKNEIKYQCIIIVFIVFIYLGEFISDYFTSNISKHTALAHVIHTAIADLTLFLMSISCTIFPVYFKAKNKTESTLALQIVGQNSKTSSSSSTKSKCTVNEMLNVISNYHGFQRFMMHLVTEYATETLFFASELIQIKNEFQRKHNNILTLPKYTRDLTTLKSEKKEFQIIDFNIIKFSESFPGEDIESEKHSSIIEMMPASSYLFNAKGCIYCMIRLPVGIPKSELIHLHKTSLKNQLYELYLKYIKIGCIHEINISANARNIVEEYFKDYNKDENTETNDDEEDFKILNIMDVACIEVIKLMFVPYSRFYLNEHIIMDHDLNASFISKKWNRRAIHKEASHSMLERQYNISS